MKRAWPKPVEFISEKSSEYLALMAIELNEAFEEAIDFLVPLIRPFEDLYLLLSQLREKSLPDEKPRLVLKLLSNIFTEDYESYDQTFRNILSRLIQAEPAIAEEFTYIRMDRYLTQRDL